MPNCYPGMNILSPDYDPACFEEGGELYGQFGSTQDIDPSLFDIDPMDWSEGYDPETGTFSEDIISWQDANLDWLPGTSGYESFFDYIQTQGFGTEDPVITPTDISPPSSGWDIDWAHLEEGLEDLGDLPRPTENIYGTDWLPGQAVEYGDPSGKLFMKEKIEEFLLKQDGFYIDFDHPDYESLINLYEQSGIVMYTGEQGTWVGEGAHLDPGEGTVDEINAAKMMLSVVKEHDWAKEQRQRQKTRMSVQSAMDDIKKVNRVGQEKKSKLDEQIGRTGLIGFGQAKDIVGSLYSTVETGTGRARSDINRTFLQYKKNIHTNRQDYINELWDLYGTFLGWQAADE